MAIKLLIILSIFLNLCNVSIIEGEKINFDEFMGEEFDTIENNYNTWLVNFVRCVDNIYISCQVTPVEPRVFIGDSECIYHASKEDHWQIVIDFYHNSMRFPNMAFVQAKNIFYNTKLTSEYDTNLRKIAIVITDQPIVADNNKTLLVGTAQLAYEEVSGYNEENQIKKIVKRKADYEDTNFSKCFMSPIKGKNIIVRCTELRPTYSTCQLQKTDYVISQYDNLLDFLMCHVSSSKTKVFLVGVLSRVNKLSLNSYGQIIHLKFENVDDLGRIVQRKMRKWLAENPEQKTYSLW
ncbi:GSCOCG00006863001-RA-CDS [Cotesia congregata]|nr:GSCOCG00006863001-RA-CDS [Cotesia congregata]